MLPFENQSPDSESVDFLATGIQDGLLTRLSKSDSLKVISRTSVERYRNTTESVPRIAAEAKAVPDGRFAVLRRSGFTLAIKMAPLPG